MTALPELDSEYARAIVDSFQTGTRVEDAIARVRAGVVDLNAFYVQTSNRGRIGTPLTFAVMDGAVGHIARLIELGADPNARRIDPETGRASVPMTYHARSVEMIDALVEGGADVRASTDETLLHHFVRMTRLTRHAMYPTLAAAAVRHGADPKQTDARGIDAIAFAKEMGASVYKLYGPIFGAPPAPAPAPRSSARSKPRTKR